GATGAAGEARAGDTVVRAGTPVGSAGTPVGSAGTPGGPPHPAAHLPELRRSLLDHLSPIRPRRRVGSARAFRRRHARNAALSDRPRLPRGRSGGHGERTPPAELILLRNHGGLNACPRAKVHASCAHRSPPTGKNATSRSPRSRAAKWS